MESQTNLLNFFCENFNKSNKDFGELNNAIFGAFLTHHQVQYNEILRITHSESTRINVKNIQSILYKLFMGFDPEKVQERTFDVLEALISGSFDYCNDELSDDAIEMLNQIKANCEKYVKRKQRVKDNDVTIDSVNLDTQINNSQNIPSTTQMANILHNLNNNSNTQVIRDTQINNSNPTSSTDQLLRGLYNKIENFSLDFKIHKEEMNKEMQKTLDDRLKSFEHDNDKKTQERLLKSNLNRQIQNILKSEHNIKIMSTHLKNSTTPKCLDILHFPTPFLATDEAFVAKYNVIIKDFQVKLMNFISEYLENKVNSCSNQICEIKVALSDLGLKSEAIYTETKTKNEKLFLNKFKSGFEKAQNAKASEFQVIKKLQSRAPSVNSGFSSNSNVSFKSNRTKYSHSSTKPTKSILKPSTDRYRSRSNSNHTSHTSREGKKFQQGYRYPSLERSFQPPMQPRYQPPISPRFQPPINTRYQSEKYHDTTERSRSHHQRSVGSYNSDQRLPYRYNANNTNQSNFHIQHQKFKRKPRFN